MNKCITSAGRVTVCPHPLFREGFIRFNRTDIRHKWRVIKCKTAYRAFRENSAIQNGSTLHMTRCDYDAVFYRVFCVTLLCIAFTFTIILTNVFIDIDGILSSKQTKPKSDVVPDDVVIQNDFTRNPSSNDDTNSDDDGFYRTKRSIETQNFLFHINNPKIKTLLTTRLESLLEALDAEESPQKVKTVKTIPKNEINDNSKDPEKATDKIREETVKRQKDEDITHLTIHNILLQGIIGHMNLNEVYKRVNSLMHKLETEGEQTGNQNTEELQNPMKLISEEENSKKISPEDRIVAEIVKCNELQDQILSTAVQKIMRQTALDQKKAAPAAKVLGKTDLEKQNRTPPQKLVQPAQDISINTKLGPDISIKTTIDIQSKSTGNESDNAITKGNIHGIIELIYNGKSIKFTKPDVENKQNTQKKPPLNIIQPKYTKIKKVSTEVTSQANAEVQNNIKRIPKDYINRFVTEYFKHFPVENKDFTKEIKEKTVTKRMKRHVKIKFQNDGNHIIKKHHDKTHKKKNKDDDELYVEIETHFDSKGTKSEKRQKLIKSIIEKIQKAINSDDLFKELSKNGDKNKKSKSLHVKKRIQDPLEHKDRILMNKYTRPVDNVIHRQLNPIIGPRKTLNGDNYETNMRDKSGDPWKKEFNGPTFLTRTKSINSAEMSEVEVDYNNVLKVNGIPQRLQKPLNNEMSDELVKSGPYFDMGNMKFFIKDIDGSGFSIGFNQYVDEQPDPETVQLFTGLKDVLKKYHENTDQTQELPIDNNSDYDNKQETIPELKNDHIIVRRSVNEKHDYHSNEYKIIYNGNSLPYNDYKEIFESRNTKKRTRIHDNSYKTPLVVDEHIFDKNLKPSEIFGLANLFRKKRALKVRKISSLRSKLKINRFLNTKAMSTKRIFLNKKRNKRDINKIRIIASDYPYKQASDENIFVVSDENIFADRATVKDIEKSDSEPEKFDEQVYVPMEAPDKPFDILYAKSRHNKLMSKYPHIFLEEIAKSKEDTAPDNSVILGKMPRYRKYEPPVENIENVYEKILHENATADYAFTDVTEMPTSPEAKVQELVEALQSPKSNYKITVKVTPKNGTFMNTGFKEIHTSINKRYNKDGLIYSSLVNVSEISKVTNLNKTKDPVFDNDAVIAIKMKDENGKMQSILREHQKNINEQLRKLNEERKNIETLLVKEKNNHSADLLLKLNELRRKSTTTKTTAATTISSTISTTQPTVTQPITQQTTKSTLIITEKTQRNILKTLEKNENLTTEILKKMDKNTEIIQTFLKKLSDKIVAPKPEYKSYKYEERTEDPVIKHNYNHPFALEWKHQFNTNGIRRNDSHLAIPFVYTYQHPAGYNARSDNSNPIASVVYHAHIHGHSNSVPVKELGRIHDHKMAEPESQTKFFLDDSLDNSYKVLPVNEINKLTAYTNMTNI